MVKAGIYRIQSVFRQEKFYIGSSSNLKRRETEHWGDLRANRHYNSKLQRYYNKYGAGSLIFIIIEEVPIDFLIEREQYYLDTLHPWFNINILANSTLGVKRSKLTRDKISKGNKGKKRTPEQIEANRLRNIGRIQSPESIKKRSISTMGHVVTEETRRKISVANSGKKRTPEMIARQGLSRLGKKDSPETIAKKKASSKHLKHTEEFKEMMRDKMTGRVLSEETKKKIGLAGIGRTCSAETRAKMSESHKGKNTWMKGRPSPMKGKTYSEEICLKMSVAQKGKKPKNPELTRIRKREGSIRGWEKRRLTCNKKIA